MNTMQVELAGRYRLTSELLAAGLQVAIPVYDDGVDLLAYHLGDGEVAARPIQLKASTKRAFALDRKYEKRANLIMAYVWHVVDPDQATTYAMPYKEAATIAKKLGWTKTQSWAKGKYSNNNPGARVRQLLEPHAMSPGAWRNLIGGREV